MDKRGNLISGEIERYASVRWKDGWLQDNVVGKVNKAGYFQLTISIHSEQYVTIAFFGSQIDASRAWLVLNIGTTVSTVNVKFSQTSQLDEFNIVVSVPLTTQNILSIQNEY